MALLAFHMKQNANEIDALASAVDAKSAWQPDESAPIEGGSHDETITALRTPSIDTFLMALLRLSREFGTPVSETDVRAICPIPATGMTEETFLQSAQRLGYKVRRVRLAAHNINHLPAPFVLLGDNEADALVATGRDDVGFKVYRPLDGETVTMPNEAALAFASEVMLVAPQSDFATGESWRAPIFNRLKGTLWMLVVASMFVNLIALASPLFIMTVYNKVIGQRALDTLDVLVFGMVVLYGFDFFLRGIRNYVANHTGARMDALIGIEVVHRLVHLPYHDFETTPTGLISERLRQLDTIRMFFTSHMPLVIVDLLFVSLFVAALYYLNSTIGSIVIATIPVFVGISMAFHRGQKRLAEESFTAHAAKTQALGEIVANAITVKSLGLESEMESRWGKRLAISAQTSFRASNLAGLASLFGHLLQQLISLLIVVIGAHLVIAGEMTLGALIGVSIIASRALAPMRQVVSAWNQVQEVRVAFRSLDKIMDEALGADSGEPSAQSTLKGKIVLENVSFAYDRSFPAVLRNINLTIESGAVVCVMGPSGSGKSTLSKLVQGIYKPESGRIIIDQEDIAHLSPHWLRRQLGVVPQETQLFAGSIRENIAIGAPGVAPEHVVNAARLVGIHDFIQQLPKGYGTILSERSGGLSAGQCQLICIARALVRNPKVLLLDEPTSALDSVAEEHLLRNLRRLAGSRTIVIISHRLAPASIADQVVLLSGGKILATGSPGEIAKRVRESHLKDQTASRQDGPAAVSLDSSQSEGVATRHVTAG